EANVEPLSRIETAINGALQAGGTAMFPRLFPSQHWREQWSNFSMTRGLAGASHGHSMGISSATMIERLPLVTFPGTSMHLMASSWDILMVGAWGLRKAGTRSHSS